jgi:hypothetical protein
VERARSLSLSLLSHLDGLVRHEGGGLRGRQLGHGRFLHVVLPRVLELRGPPRQEPRRLCVASIKHDHEGDDESRGVRVQVR